MKDNEPQQQPGSSQATQSQRSSSQASSSAQSSSAQSSSAQSSSSQSSSSKQATGGRNILSADVEIKGKVNFTNDLVVDGKIEGEIISDGSLTIGENARIKAEIRTRSVVIYGKVYGNITVTDRVELKKEAELIGDIKAATISIEAGAIFVGKSTVGTPTAKPAVTPAATQPAATSSKTADASSKPVPVVSGSMDRPASMSKPSGSAAKPSSMSKPSDTKSATPAAGTSGKKSA